MAIEFEVFGHPVTQGSTRVVPLKDKGGGYQMLPDGRPKLVPIHQKGKELRAWRQEIAYAARNAYRGPLLQGAVALTLIFERPRPKGDFGTGKNASVLKPSARPYPTQKPDSVKLTRAIEDALTGVLWQDDSQVVNHTIYKRWGDCFRVYVRINDLTPGLPPAGELPSQAGESTLAFPSVPSHDPGANGQSSGAPVPSREAP